MSDDLKLSATLDVAATLTAVKQVHEAIDGVTEATKKSGEAAQTAKAADDAHATSMYDLAKKAKDVEQAHGDAEVKVQQFAGGLHEVGGALAGVNPALGQLVSQAGTATSTIGQLASGGLGPLGVAISATTALLTVYAEHEADVETRTRAITDATHGQVTSIRSLISAMHDQQAAERENAQLRGANGSGEGFEAQLADLGRRRQEIINQQALAQHSLLGASESEARAAREGLAQVDAQIADTSQRLTEFRRNFGNVDEVSGGIASPEAVAAAQQAQRDDERQQVADQNAKAQAAEDARAAGRRGGGSRGPTARSQAAAITLDHIEIWAQEEEAAEAATKADAERIARVRAAQDEAHDHERELFRARQAEDEQAAVNRERVLANERKYIEDTARAASQHTRNRIQQWGQLGTVASGIFELIASTEGKSVQQQKEANIIRLVGKGTEEVIQSAIDIATGVSFSVENPVLAATKFISAGLHAAAAAQAFAAAGSGGGASAGAGGGGAAGAAVRPSTFDSRPTNDNGGTGSIVINLGVFPGVDHAETGRAIIQSIAAAGRLDGDTFQRVA